MQIEKNEEVRSRKHRIAMVAEKILTSMVQGKGVYEQVHNPSKAATQAVEMATILVDFSDEFNI